jgi:hypothetical protein
VAEYLVEHIDASTLPAPDFGAAAPRKKLASRLNLTPETLCRILAGFRRKGWIESPDNVRITVKDSAAIRQLLSPNRNNGE